MVITYEVLNEDMLLILEQLERLHLLRRIPENGSKSEAVDNATLSTVIPDQLVVWANEPHLTPSQKSARIQLIPQLLEHYQASHSNLDNVAGNIPSDAWRQRRSELAQITQEQRTDKPKLKRKWAGTISREAGEKMLKHVEQVRNEWERNL